MKKIICIIIILLSSESSIGQVKMQLFNEDGKIGIPFILTSDKKKFYSDDEGKLNLSKSEHRTYGDSLFEIIFFNDLDITIFYNKLYFSPGESYKDPYVSFKSVRLQNLFKDNDNYFYLRLRSTNLDEEEPIENLQLNKN